jgi:hypothetical protein
MLLKCPRCFQDLLLADDQLPADNKVWLKCPACGEVFLPVCPEVAATFITVPPAPNPKIYDLVSSMSRVGSKKVQLEGLGQCIPVQPVKIPAVFWQAGFGILAVCVIFLALGFGFKGSEIEPPPVLSPSPQAPQRDPETRLAHDFTAWKEEILSRRTLSKTVTYMGRESMIYKHLIELMAPESCQDLTAVKMWSKRTADGLRVQGVCVDPQQTGALLEIEWLSDSAVITLAGENSSIAVPLTDGGVGQQTSLPRESL